MTALSMYIWTLALRHHKLIFWRPWFFSVSVIFYDWESRLVDRHKLSSYIVVFVGSCGISNIIVLIYHSLPLSQQHKWWYHNEYGLWMIAHLAQLIPLTKGPIMWSFDIRDTMAPMWHHCKGFGIQVGLYKHKCTKSCRILQNATLISIFLIELHWNIMWNVSCNSMTVFYHFSSTLLSISVQFGLLIPLLSCVYN